MTGDDVSLRDYVDTRVHDLRDRFDNRIEDLRSQISAALEASDKANVKADMATDKRFEAANAFKDAMQTQQRAFLPRSEYEQLHRALSARVDENTEVLAAIRAEKHGMGTLIAYIIGGAGLVLTIVNIIFFVVGLTHRQ